MIRFLKSRMQVVSASLSAFVHMGTVLTFLAIAIFVLSVSVSVQMGIWFHRCSYLMSVHLRWAKKTITVSFSLPAIFLFNKNACTVSYVFVVFFMIFRSDFFLSFNASYNIMHWRFFNVLSINLCPALAKFYQYFNAERTVAYPIGYATVRSIDW